MDEKTKQTDTELFDSDSSEGDAPSASNSEDIEEPIESTFELVEREQGGSQIGTEENEESFVPKEKYEKKQSEREAQIQGQVDSWMVKLISGKADIDDLPPNMQWLRPRLEGELALLNKAPDIENLVERKFREKEEKLTYEALTSRLKKTRLNKAQQEAVQIEYTDLRDSGLSKAKALEKAMRLAGIDFDEIKRNELRSSMRIPRTGGSPEVEHDFSDAESLKKVPESKRIAMYENQRLADQSYQRPRTP